MWRNGTRVILPNVGKARGCVRVCQACGSQCGRLLGPGSPSPAWNTGSAQMAQKVGHKQS